VALWLAMTGRGPAFGERSMTGAAVGVEQQPPARPQTRCVRGEEQVIEKGTVLGGSNFTHL
jgi:hypothetical protein